LRRSLDRRLVNSRGEVCTGPGASVPGGGRVAIRLGSVCVVARDHGALARAIHRHGGEQANHRKKSVHMPVLVAHECKRAVLGLEPPEGVDEDVHPGRVHERDLGQINDHGTGLALENRQQDLSEHVAGPKIDVAVETEDCDVLMLLVSHQQTDRHGPGRRRRRGVGLLRGH
jgi:hypothetical protein